MGALRSAENLTTGFTPNYLMLGREVRHPYHLMMGVSQKLKEKEPYVRDMQDTMERVHSIVRRTLGASQIRQKRDYDLHARPSTYGVGDVVLLANSARKVGVCPKLAPLWKGPYVMVGVPSTVLCRLASARKEWVVQ